MFSSVRNTLVYGLRGFARENAACRRIVSRLLKLERADPEIVKLYVREQLFRTLKAAAQRIPFYRGYEVLRDRDNIETHLVRNYPIVKKADLLTKPDDFYPKVRSYPWTIWGKTSGTSGTPLAIIRSAESVLWAHAFKKRHWAWSGFADGMPYVTLRGDFVIPVEQDEPPFWFRNRWCNQLIVSSRHLRRRFVPRIVDEIDRFRPYLMEAYPSTAYEVARYLEEEDRYVFIPYVYTGSEPLYSHQRELIERRFRTRIMDHYGMAERVAYATQCEHGNMHVNSDYSFVEIVDEHDNPTTDYGYVVGTTFHNLAMPLIRYRLSDQARWKPGSCPCGRVYPMIEPVVGKWEDVLYSSENAAVSASVITFVFKALHNIEKSQVAQVGEGEWEVRVVPMPGFQESDRERIVQNIHKTVDPNLKVRVLLVDDIPRTSAGKYKWVVNEFRR